jgi:plasmid maintenance system antidote protein VapI
MNEEAQMLPVHSGERRLKESMEPVSNSGYWPARDNVALPSRTNERGHGREPLSADTALRLSLRVGLPKRFWQAL